MFSLFDTKFIATPGDQIQLWLPQARRFSGTGYF